MQHLVRKIQHLSNYGHPVAVLGQMSCQAKANVQNSLYCSWSRNTDGPSMETIFCAYCTTICYRLMICHRFIAFKRLFMNPLYKRAYGLRGAAEHLWSCSPFVGYMTVTEKKLACLWPLITYLSCEVRVSVIICMGLCRCVCVKEMGLGQRRWTPCSQTWLGNISFQWHCSVGIRALPLHFPLETDILCLRLDRTLELVC